MYRVRVGAIVIMYDITITNKEIVFVLYMNAGPTYILTFPTSSLIRFIRSPVLLFL